MHTTSPASHLSRSFRRFQSSSMTSIALVVSSAAVLAASAPAQDPAARRPSPIRAWTDGLQPARAAMPDDPAVVRQRFIDPRIADLAGASVDSFLRMELFDDRVVDGLIQRRIDRRADRFTLAGAIGPGGIGGDFTLAVNGDVLAASIRIAGGETYRVRRTADGGHAVQAVDAARLSACEVGPIDPGLLGAAPAYSKRAGGGCGDGSVIDLLVVFTPAARDEVGGIAAMEAEIDIMVEDANIGCLNSGIATQLNLVHTRLFDISEASLTLGQLTDPEDGILDGVHRLRDAYGADQVALIRSGGGGVANGLYNLDPNSGMDALAFNITGVAGTVAYVLAHEVGHNLGCCHAFGDGGGCPGEGGLLFPFSNGHRYNGLSGTLWRTIMAYPPGERLRHFSNPDILIDGAPTGLAPDVRERGADNAQTINASALFVSNHRCNDGVCEGLDLPSTGGDCDDNGVPDACEIALGQGMDCDENGVVDACQIFDGSATDVDGDGVLDQCADCNGNGLADVNDVLNGGIADCNLNYIPDSCETDCDGNGAPDQCDLLFRADSPMMSPFGTGLPGQHIAPAVPVASDDVLFEIEAVADLGAADQTIALLLNGVVIHTFFDTTGASCSALPVRDRFTYPRAFFNILASNDPQRDVTLELIASATVNPAACVGETYALVRMRVPTDPPQSDADSNGVIDPCQARGDTNGDGVVNVTDLLAILASWGPCNACPADTDGSGDVTVTDLLALLGNWG